MSILTVLLVAIFFAAWKAPRWVKEIGQIALFDVVPIGVICGGLKVTLNTTIYGIGIYLVSLIVRIVQKPRL